MTMNETFRRFCVNFNKITIDGEIQFWGNICCCSKGGKKVKIHLVKVKENNTFNFYVSIDTGVRNNIFFPYSEVKESVQKNLGIWKKL